MWSGVSAKEGTGQRAANKWSSCCFSRVGRVQGPSTRKRINFSPGTFNSNHLGMEHQIIRKGFIEDLSLNVTSEGESTDGHETKPHCVEQEFTNLDTGLIKSPVPFFSDRSSPESSSISSYSSHDDSYESFVPTQITQVLPRLYLGNQEDAEQEEKMMNLGITHIISIVGRGRYSHYCENYRYIPLRDNGSSDLLVQLDRSYNFMVGSQKPHSKLFIHCKLGQNRSASLVIGFLMRYQQCCLFDAYTFLKQKRELIHPHFKYMRQLRELDIQLNGVYSTPKGFLRVSLCTENGINIQHENFTKTMSDELIELQSGETTEESPVPKERKVKKLLESRPPDIVDSNSNSEKSAQRPFTISSTRILREVNAYDESGYHSHSDDIPCVVFRQRVAYQR